MCETRGTTAAFYATDREAVDAVLAQASHNAVQSQKSSGAMFLFYRVLVNTRNHGYSSLLSQWGLM